jgi:hypothetical protein
MATQKTVRMKTVHLEEVIVPIVGMTGLLVDAFQDDAEQAITDKSEGIRGKQKKAIKPEEEFVKAKHFARLGKEIFEAFPAYGFKRAALRGAKSAGLVMKDTAGTFHVLGDDDTQNYVRINGESQPLKDMPKNRMGQRVIKYKAFYPEWRADLRIMFDSNAMSLDDLYTILHLGGFICGVGNKRPGSEHSGRFGTFDVKR